LAVCFKTAAKGSSGSEPELIFAVDPCKIVIGVCRSDLSVLSHASPGRQPVQWHFWTFGVWFLLKRLSVESISAIRGSWSAGTSLRPPILGQDAASILP
jgi:hypothetical protein